MSAIRSSPCRADGSPVFVHLLSIWVFSNHRHYMLLNCDASLACLICNWLSSISALLHVHHVMAYGALFLMLIFLV